ncbi:hypothetical protein Q73A0000_02270 [Kaistella flava (ex Peng et al. 2021)]|uniref:Uncharacterized protein n=1 Tax=Kaistella flava (ex Peng et al. 2021) TaxID=2038776 RepID=A0A7M2Y6L0_9FLAO|nr:hypothetical protein [Kaistella flava (ex Peng et al. 2021)]QOW09265.1 hypothetical protein Q73A0000_02270 [Kaistella flava (ex Peng et al. 2021)]
MFSQNLKEYRTLIQLSKDSENASKTLIEKSMSSYNTTKEPIFAGFVAVGDFFMAKHAFNPIKKISYFNHGKKMLEMAVATDPSNLEIRLMRLIAQENIPRILGYHQHIDEDRNFLHKNYKKTNDSELKNFIIEYLKL